MRDGCFEKITIASGLNHFADNKHRFEPRKKGKKREIDKPINSGEYTDKSVE
jgi:hypothetical protein